MLYALSSLELVITAELLKFTSSYSTYSGKKCQFTKPTGSDHEFSSAIADARGIFVLSDSQLLQLTRATYNK